MKIYNPNLNKMKFYKSLIYLFAFVFILSISSCSDDTELENQEASQLLVGEWLLLSQSIYNCGTEEPVGGTQCCLADLDDIFVFNSDGTWGGYNNGTYEEEASEYSQRGTWEYINGNTYKVYYASDDLMETLVIEFEDNNTMKYDISDCWEMSDGTSIYEYDVMTRE